MIARRLIEVFSADWFAAICIFGFIVLAAHLAVQVLDDEVRAEATRWKIYSATHHCVLRETWEKPNRYVCDGGEEIVR